jgi:hypothetical protein
VGEEAAQDRIDDVDDDRGAEQQRRRGDFPG